MKNNFKLGLGAAAVLMASSVAHAGVANVSGNGSEDNPYLMGVIGPSASVLAATVTGSPGSFFDEFANFTISTLSSVSGSAKTYSLDLGEDITGLTVEVWRGIHPESGTLFASFSGENATNVIGDLTPGQYHLDISGNLGSSSDTGQYSVELQALPVPEPETYAMLLAGLGLVGFYTHRRKII